MKKKRDMNGEVIWASSIWWNSFSSGKDIYNTFIIPHATDENSLINGPKDSIANVINPNKILQKTTKKLIKSILTEVSTLMRARIS